MEDKNQIHYDIAELLEKIAHLNIKLASTTKIHPVELDLLRNYVRELDKLADALPVLQLPKPTFAPPTPAVEPPSLFNLGLAEDRGHTAEAEAQPEPQEEETEQAEPESEGIKEEEAPVASWDFAPQTPIEEEAVLPEPVEEEPVAVDEGEEILAEPTDDMEQVGGGDEEPVTQTALQEEAFSFAPETVWEEPVAEEEAPFVVWAEPETEETTVGDTSAEDEVSTEPFAEEEQEDSPLDADVAEQPQAPVWSSHAPQATEQQVFEEVEDTVESEEPIPHIEEETETPEDFLQQQEAPVWASHTPQATEQQVFEEVEDTIEDEGPIPHVEEETETGTPEDFPQQEEGPQQQDAPVWASYAPPATEPPVFDAGEDRIENEEPIPHIEEETTVQERESFPLATDVKAQREESAQQQQEPHPTPQWPTDPQSPTETKRSLNDLFSREAGHDTSSRFQFQTRRNLREMIDLSERYIFTKELFGGDADYYDRAIRQLNQFETLPEAQNYIVNELRQRYKWEGKEQVERQFIKIVERRFA